jgi:hypothetical protein
LVFRGEVAATPEAVTQAVAIVAGILVEVVIRAEEAVLLGVGAQATLIVA